MYHFPDEITFFRAEDGILYARLHNQFTLVVIDGIPVKYYDYHAIPGIPPSEVKSFELISHARNFDKLYCEAAPSCPPLVPTVGNVIAIYTYAGKGLSGISATPGLNKMTAPAFSPTREFYAPRYETLKPEQAAKPDLRNLLHWQPVLKSDTTGKTSLTFYNSDNTGRIKVIVEAISENGEIGYEELFYEVRKKE
jgi:hypothetical protein